MLSLPSLQGIPALVRTGSRTPMAAELALLVAGKAEIAPPRRAVQSLEVDVLHRLLSKWLEEQREQLEIFAPGLHLTLGADSELSNAFEGSAFNLWLGSHINGPVESHWYMEHRWNQLELDAPGLAAAALAAIQHAAFHSFPVYTPAICEEYACWTYWRGEMDETEIMAEYRSEEGEDAEVPDDMITRAKFDAALPKFVQRPKSSLNVGKLERLAKRGAHRGEIARLVLELRAECKASHRRKSPDFQRGEMDELAACGFAAMLRWKKNDPMAQAWDDHFNEMGQAMSVEEAYGVYTGKSVSALPAILRDIEHRFRIASKVEKLLPLISIREK